MKSLLQMPLPALAGQIGPVSRGSPGKVWGLLAQIGQISRWTLMVCSVSALGLGAYSLTVGGCPNASGALVSGLCGLGIAWLTRTLLRLPPAAASRQ